MDMPIYLDMGMETMEISFECAEQNPSLITQFGLSNQNGVQLIFRAVKEDDSNTSSYVITARGMVTSLELGDVTAGERNNINITITLRYLKIVDNNVVLVEIDADNMKRVILGIDQRQGQRDAIGLNSLSAFNSLSGLLIS
jgi:uncharacterized protein